MKPADSALAGEEMCHLTATVSEAGAQPYLVSNSRRFWLALPENLIGRGNSGVKFLKEDLDHWRLGTVVQPAPNNSAKFSTGTMLRMCPVAERLIRRVKAAKRMAGQDGPPVRPVPGGDERPGFLRPRSDDRRVISGIVHVLRSGCRWCDCPPEYGPPTTDL